MARGVFILVRQIKYMYTFFGKQIIYYKSWFLSFVIINCANFQNTPSDRKYPNTFQDTVNHTVKKRTSLRAIHT